MPARTASPLLALLAALALVGGAAAADNGDGEAPNEGYLTAFSCAPMPDKPTVQVVAQDDTAEMVRLKAELVAALKARKARIAAPAPLRVSLYVETSRAPVLRKGRDFAEFKHDPLSQSAPENLFRFNIWSNRRDSLVGGRRDEVLQSAVDRMRVSIFIHDTSNGQCVWQGEAVYDIGERNEDALAARLISALVPRIGTSVKAAPLVLR